MKWHEIQGDCLIFGAENGHGWVSKKAPYTFSVVRFYNRDDGTLSHITHTEGETLSAGDAKKRVEEILSQ